MTEKIVVFGSRKQLDADICLRILKEELDGKDILAIISGTADGADTFGEIYAESRGIPVVRYPPDYKRYGSPAAQFVRNTLMARDCDRGVALWNGISTGTHHMMGEMRRYGKPFKLYKITGTTVEDMTANSLENFYEDS
jgi:hypothetical protein